MSQPNPTCWPNPSDFNTSIISLERPSPTLKSGQMSLFYTLTAPCAFPLKQWPSVVTFLLDGLKLHFPFDHGLPEGRDMLDTTSLQSPVLCRHSTNTWWVSEPSHLLGMSLGWLLYLFGACILLWKMRGLGFMVARLLQAAHSTVRILRARSSRIR